MSHQPSPIRASQNLLSFRQQMEGIKSLTEGRACAADDDGDVQESDQESVAVPDTPDIPDMTTLASRAIGRLHGGRRTCG